MGAIESTRINVKKPAHICRKLAAGKRRISVFCDLNFRQWPDIMEFSASG